MANVIQRPISLDEVTEFHDQLRRLMSAGLSFDLGQGARWPVTGLVEVDFSKQLDLLIAHLANQLARGRSVEESLTDTAYFSPQYRLALESWCYGQGSPTAFDALHQPARQQHELRTDLSLSMLHPLIVLVLCLAGCLILAVVMAPKLESIYLQLRQPHSRSLQWLVEIRSWALVWVPLTVIALVIGWRWWRRTPLLRFARWSKRSQLLKRCRAQQIASNYAEIASQAGPHHQQAVAGAMESQLNADKEVGSLPMLQWTLRTVKESTSEGSESTSSGLEPRYACRTTAHLYEQLLGYQNQRRKSWLPVALSILIGGLAVLLYGLLLFPPIIALLMDVIRTAN